MSMIVLTLFKSLSSTNSHDLADFDPYFITLAPASVLTDAGVFHLLGGTKPYQRSLAVSQATQTSRIQTHQGTMVKKRLENSPTEEPTPQKPTLKKKPVKKRATGDLPWHPFWRWLVSLLVVLHLTAVFSAPWDMLLIGDALPPGYEAMQPQRPLPPPESVVWQKPVITRGLHAFFHDYLNLLYLNHGYEFFAPDPAGTHVIDYQVTQSDGNIVEGRLPSHEGQWPRLLYHRHMMLAEQTQMMGPSSGLQYADHLATLYGGPSQMQLKIHLLLPPHRVADKTPLDAPSTFQTVGTVTGRPRSKASTDSPTPQKPATQQPTSQQGAQQ